MQKNRIKPLYFSTSEVQKTMFVTTQVSKKNIEKVKKVKLPRISR